MNKKVVLVLGSGATVGGNFKVHYDGEDFEPPMDHNFFETLLLKIILKAEEYPALCYYKKRFKEKSFEATFSKIDLIAKLCLGKVISEEHAYETIKDEMGKKAEKDSSYKRKMEDECCRSRVPAMAAWEFIDLIRKVCKDLKPPQSSSSSPLHSLVNELYDKGLLHCIISYNYDLSVESIKEFDDKFYYPIIESSESSKSKRIPFYKLHGSLNWKEGTGNQNQITRDANNVVPMEYRSAGDYIQSSIIPPTLFKQEINIDFQRDYRASFYKTLWKECWQHLQEADSVIIVGFSFPATDWHAQMLFESAGSKRGGFKKIVYCHKDDKFEKENTINSIIGDADFVEESKGLKNLIDNIGKFLKFIHS